MTEQTLAPEVGSFQKRLLAVLQGVSGPGEGDEALEQMAKVADPALPLPVRRLLAKYWLGQMSQAQLRIMLNLEQGSAMWREFRQTWVLEPYEALRAARRMQKREKRAKLLEDLALKQRQDEAGMARRGQTLTTYQEIARRHGLSLRTVMRVLDTQQDQITLARSLAEKQPVTRSSWTVVAGESGQADLLDDQNG